MSEQNFEESAKQELDENEVHNRNAKKMTNDTYWELQRSIENFGITGSESIKNWFENHITETILTEKIHTNKILLSRIIVTVDQGELIENVGHQGWIEGSSHAYVPIERTGTQPYEFLLVLNDADERVSLAKKLEKLQNYQNVSDIEDEAYISTRVKELYMLAPFNVVLHPYSITANPLFLESPETEGTTQIVWRDDEHGSLFANDRAQHEPFIFNADPNMSDLYFGFDRWDSTDLQKSVWTVCRCIGQHFAQTLYEKTWAVNMALERIQPPLVRPDDTDEGYILYSEIRRAVPRAE